MLSGIELFHIPLDRAKEVLLPRGLFLIRRRRPFCRMRSHTLLILGKVIAWSRYTEHTPDKTMEIIIARAHPQLNGGVWLLDAYLRNK
jgi:hypothetical protein